MANSPQSLLCECFQRGPAGSDLKGNELLSGQIQGQSTLQVLKLAESSIKPHGEDVSDHTEDTAKGTEY